MQLKELARRKGKKFDQLGLAPQYVSALNTGRYRAGPDAIAKIAVALGELPEVVAATCDQCWQAAAATRAVASSPTTPASA